MKIKMAIGVLIGLTTLSTHAKTLGRERIETVSCHLQFGAATTKEGLQSAVVTQGQALLRGEVQGVSYVLSVRGKTAVARLTLSPQGPVLQSEGAIELLRGGGQKAKATQLFKNGDDDERDDEIEREGGFTIKYSENIEIQNPDLQLICESTNERK